MNDPEVLKALNSQLNFQSKIKKNTSLLKDISMGGFNEEKIEIFARENNLELKNYKISDIKQNEIFSEGIIKRIFLTKDGEVDLITDSTLSNNYLILAISTKYKEIKESSNEFERYEAKARLDLINKIYKNFDDQLNKKYKVVLNQRTIERVKDSF
jgi:peptidyl-prolyl cis-trans isomerase D